MTGGGRGIGREIALGLSDRGMTVIVVARTEAEVQETAKLTKGVAVVADVSNSKDVQRYIMRPLPS